MADSLLGCGGWDLMLPQSRNQYRKKNSDTQTPFGTREAPKDKEVWRFVGWCDGATYQCHIMVTPGTCRVYFDAT